LSGFIRAGFWRGCCVRWEYGCCFCRRIPLTTTPLRRLFSTLFISLKTVQSTHPLLPQLMWTVGSVGSRGTTQSDVNQFRSVISTCTLLALDFPQKKQACAYKKDSPSSVNIRASSSVGNLSYGSTSISSRESSSGFNTITNITVTLKRSASDEQKLHA
jgi:hypothetical protein